VKAKLIERGTTPEQTREIPLSQPEFLIGRGADCDLRLRVSSISRHHCLIRLVNEEATIVDLGSSNGTYLNGERVRSQAPLHNGDELQMGNCRFQVELGDGGTSDCDTAVGTSPFTRTVKLPPEVAKNPAKESSPADPGDCAGL
jgi:pSer/pThr/pTyr-binding forkhead associated (FHA) protein